MFKWLLINAVQSQLEPTISDPSNQMKSEISLYLFSVTKVSVKAFCYVPSSFLLEI